MMGTMDSAGFYDNGAGDDAGGASAGSGVDRVELLSRRARRITGQINALQAELSDAVADLAEALDDDPSGAGFGFRSVEHRISHELHLSTSEATRYLTVGRGAAERPALSAAFANGELGLTAADVITRSSDGETEADLVRYANDLSVGQLQRTCAHTRRLNDPEPPPQEIVDHVSLVGHHEGGFVMNGRWTDAHGAAIREQLAQTRAELSHRKPDGTMHHATMAEALWHLLANGGGAVNERFLAMVTIDLDEFEESGGSDGVAAPDGTPITDAELDRIFDERIRARWMLRRGGHPVWVSHETRLAPGWMRQVLATMQPECVIDGCGVTTGLHAHHVVHWEDRQQTSVDGLAMICGHHHRTLHEHPDLRLRRHPELTGLFMVVTLDGTRWKPPPKVSKPLEAEPPEVDGPSKPLGESLTAYGLDCYLGRLYRPPKDDPDLE